MREHHDHHDHHHEYHEHMRAHRRRRRIVVLVCIAVICVALIGTYLAIRIKAEERERPAPEVLTVATLEKIVNVSELSSFTSVYNGIAEVMNAKDPHKVDYYVSYEATVDAGIDFKDVEISLDRRDMTIRVELPEVYITDTEVKIESLDYIFYNEKANRSSVSEEAFKACKADVEQESAKQKDIYELAHKNAVNILTALLKPIVDQAEAGYTLVIE